MKNPKKKPRRGFVYKTFEWDCYNCCCRVCTGTVCPYKKLTYGQTVSVAPSVFALTIWAAFLIAIISSESTPYRAHLKLNGGFAERENWKNGLMH